MKRFLKTGVEGFQIREPVVQGNVRQVFRSQSQVLDSLLEAEPGQVFIKIDPDGIFEQGGDVSSVVSGVSGQLI